MFINDTIDEETKEKKSHRVRSWYLYEQYKSLERNQLDAAQKLKERTYQDNILRQELQERRSRRKLYDRFDLSCERECNVQESTSDDVKATLSNSSEDFFESFCELQDDKDSETDSSIDGTFSQDDSQIGKRYLDACKSLDDIKDDQSYEESVNSVVENYKSNEDSLAADLSEKLLMVQKNITAQLDEQIANNFENNAKSYDDYNISEVNGCDSLEDLESLNESKSRNNKENLNNIANIWSKFVSFAYQVIQLNHGNCYYDYGSQFLTAVLACDVLRRGVNCMCHILQPYVSPIKYATDVSVSDSSTTSYKSTKRKRLHTHKKNRNKSKANKTQLHILPRRTKQTHHSDEYWRKLSKYTFGYKSNKRYRASEPYPSIEKLSSYYTQTTGTPSSSFLSIKNSYSKQNSVPVCPCSCHKKIPNPMLKIGQYIDRLLKDVDDCQRL